MREEVDQDRPPAIEVSKDGPYRVTGGILLFDSEGEPIARNAGASLEHYSLCRCGKSQNKPFCSGMHWYAGFHDPPAPDEPTLFQWAGGFPALTRMTRIFYAKHVPEDPLLAPLFADMSPDHPERVAAWLGEVFGGPKRYSEQYGTYDRMVSQHIGKAIGEEQRARWVELLSRSADEAGLPADPEWRAAFVAYLEWGSCIAKENATIGAHPPQHLPVPRSLGAVWRKRHWRSRARGITKRWPASLGLTTSMTCEDEVIERDRFSRVADVHDKSDRNGPSRRTLPMRPRASVDDPTGGSGRIRLATNPLRARPAHGNVARAGTRRLLPEERGDMRGSQRGARQPTPPSGRRTASSRAVA